MSLGFWGIRGWENGKLKNRKSNTHILKTVKNCSKNEESKSSKRVGNIF